MPETDVVVVGAGLAGLSCAKALSRNCAVLEKERRPGGLCRTESRRGYILDITGHYLHFSEGETRRLVMRLLRGNLLRLARDSRVTLRGREGPYPFQTNLRGHDPRVVRECLLGLLARNARSPKAGDEESYAAWILRTQGEGFARHFMLPFNRKMFRADPASLSARQGGRFVPRPSPRAIIRGALLVPPRNTGYNAIIWYPRRGGIEALPRALARGLRPAPLCGTAMKRVFWKRGVALAANGREFPYDLLVNTAPLPMLLRALSPRIPEMDRIGRKLRWIGVMTVHFLLTRPSQSRAHWVYLPERKFAAYRYGYPGNINRRLAPPGCSLVSAEYSYVPGRRPSRAWLASRIKRDLLSLGAIESPKYIGAVAVTDAPVAYVIFDEAYAASRAAAMRFLSHHRIISIGRYGGWRYGGMSDAIREGKEAGERIAAHGRREAERWRA